MRREAVWGIVVLVDADEHETIMRKAVEEWVQGEWQSHPDS